MNAEFEQPSIARIAESLRAVPDERPPPPEEGVALCLSGGGYRAMLFHVGAFWRLNELTVLVTYTRLSVPARAGGH
jgi:NTE family protein